MNDGFGSRFLRPSEFLGYAEHLAVLHSGLGRQLLEFLDRERLLTPICRVRFPPEVFRHWRGLAFPEYDLGGLKLETNQQRVDAANELRDRLGAWGNPWSSRFPWPQFHPLDLVDERFTEYIQIDPASEPFQPWNRANVHVGYTEGRPMTSNATEAWYRYWQVFLLADVLAMAASVTANWQEDSFLDAATHGDFQLIPKDRRWPQFHYVNWRRFREFKLYSPGFEALCFFLAYRNRVFLELGKKQSGPVIRLQGLALREFRDWETVLAHHAAWRFRQDPKAFLEFIKWQCRRWHDWDRLDRRRLTDEYRRNIDQSVYMHMLLTRQDYRQVVDEIGRVTPHFEPTLDVISPDWSAEQKRAVARSLKSWIAPSMAPWQSIGYDLRGPECEEIPEWFFEQGLHQLFWLYSRLGELTPHDPIDLSGLAREAEGLALLFEHLLNHVAQLAGQFPGATLKPKLIWLWGDVANVVQGLSQHWGLTNTTPGLSHCRAQIAALALSTPHGPIVQELLDAALIRNQGTHLSFAQLSTEEVYDLLAVLLRALVLTWKHARQRAFI
jgi:hypothetical protein